jgi:formylglycine-generating enzyme
MTVQRADTPARSTAADRLRLGRLPWRVATAMIVGACRDLAGVHTAGGVHGDVRPATLILGAGNAARLAEPEPGDSAPTMPSFLSPEQCSGRPPDARSDVYSLGATYYALLAGRPPYDAPSPVEVMDGHRHRPVPNVLAVAANIPLRCDAVIRRAMAKDPADRYPTAAAMLADVEPILAVDDTPAPLPPADLGRRPRSHRRLWAAVAAGAVLAAGVGAGGYYWSQNFPGGRPPARAENALPPINPAEFLPTIQNSVGMTLARVPAGAFAMGDPFDATALPRPVRITRPYYIGVYEVTQEQYRAVTGEAPSEFGGRDTAPVECVSWNEAVAFCEKLSERPAEQRAGRTYRLPTEAEWEFACRAATWGLYSFGDAFLPDKANARPGGLRRPVAVGTYPPNPWGLFDMHGNVCEWCADWYAPDFYRYGPWVDPRGPDTGTHRVTRGGGWDSVPELCRAGSRAGSFLPDYRGPAVGFRVVCDVKINEPAGAKVEP